MAIKNIKPKVASVFVAVAALLQIVQNVRQLEDLFEQDTASKFTNEAPVAVQPLSLNYKPTLRKQRSWEVQLDDDKERLLELDTISKFTNEATVAVQPLSLNNKPTQGKLRSWEMQLDDDKERRPLRFLHIPKTGGTSIMAMGTELGLKWGGCMFPSPWGKRECPDYNTTNLNWQPHPHESVWWHTPIQFLDPSQPSPYEGHDIFAVVRNPYERAVSEYYYHCKFKKKACFGPNLDQDTPERLNGHLQSILKRILFVEKNTAEYYTNWGHWIPQYDYFYDTNGTRLCHHMLHNEYLREDVNSLMASYGLNATLPEEKSKAREDLGAKTSVADLSVVTMKLIEVVFERDFELGGYKMMSGLS